MSTDPTPRPALGARAPRYTSYPPATQFTDAVGGAQAAAWLAEVPAERPISLYVHVPFCRRLCRFCACHTRGTRTDAPLAPYLDTLIAELDLVAEALPPGTEVGHLHLGGGTPTLLPPEGMARLFAALDARLPRTEGAETAVEVDPTELDDARMDALAEAGLTRASLGVQDFAPVVQAAIGRAQSVEQTRRAIEGLRARGTRGINLDLLYGLPLQTEASLGRTLDEVVALGPDRIALYGYAHVPWASRRQRLIREADLPDPATRMDLQDMAAERLVAAGYEAVGIDHFARPDDAMAVAARDGTLRRNFQGYTCDASDVLVGVGASAISRLPGGYAQNPAHVGQWAGRVGRGVLPTARGHALTPEDRLRGAMIERLLCDFALDPAAFDAPSRAAALIAGLLGEWPADLEPTGGGGVRLRPARRHLARLVAAGLDAYAAPAGRHSLAV